ncbi:hypothetical protein EVAR_20275_1 [Eumeta japonica]|uniref:Uncharacterized protein n=1 Tax=Eumeta variegata TaxID=151549 RepID=A0A4C1VQM2_EUMVA|nr:hypothetical protein EVAR_20275_1 [Eumeta japonica]
MLRRKRAYRPWTLEITKEFGMVAWHASIFPRRKQYDIRTEEWSELMKGEWKIWLRGEWATELSLAVRNATAKAGTSRLYSMSAWCLTILAGLFACFSQVGNGMVLPL